MANHSIEVTPEVLVELLMATATVLREATAGHTTNPSAAAALQSTGRVLLVARGGTGTHSTAPHAAGATNSSVTLEGDGVSLQALSDTAQAIGLTLMRSIMTGPPRRGSTLQVGNSRTHHQPFCCCRTAINRTRTIGSWWGPVHCATCSWRHQLLGDSGGRRREPPGFI
ncbi:Hypothetical protein, putative [Bodo saltans]|uniref:Uncharacterized protein n=1 Tax=Bodo saltans TaxID=75058 RepID=A0A0S4KHF6_BODSA|nr:Hypothetical protein, putative [Bodo saltans]|eukprot:CUI14369.1 Hypothetical protein, putative [Bodo saltans]